MLARISNRCLRGRLHLSPVQAAFLRPTSRAFAKNSKPKSPGDYKLPPTAANLTRHGPTVQRSPIVKALAGKTGAASATSSDRSGNPDLSEAQTEFSTDGGLSENNVQTNEDIRPTNTVSSKPTTSTGKPPAANSDQLGNPDYSEAQTEFSIDESSRQNNVLSNDDIKPGVVQLQPTTPTGDTSKLPDAFETNAAADADTAPSNTTHHAVNPPEATRSSLAAGTEGIPGANSSESQGQDEAPKTDATETTPQPEASTGPFPDLTQGIPPTLDSELASATSSSRADSSSTDITAPFAPGGRGGENLPKSAYMTSIDRRWNRIANTLFASFILLSITGTIYLGRDWDTLAEEEKHRDAPSGWGLRLFYGRAKARLYETIFYFNEPAFEKLLPDPRPEWERPYTLVLSLEDLLVHSEWDREHGWRLAKRPGVDYFLRYLSQYYEICIFTSVPYSNGDLILRKLDPFRIAMWPLFREATRYKNGEYIKDLSFLNRDLSKVIMIDTDPAHVQNQPENAIIVPKWKGDPKDQGLVSFIPFLEYIAAMGFNDTREVLKSFEGKHIPTEFSKREVLAREKFQQQLEDERRRQPRRSAGGLFSSLLPKPAGGAVDGMEQSMSEGFAQGKTLQDQIRERGQKQYELLEKEIRDNEAKWLAEMKAEEDRAKEEMIKGMKTGVKGFFGGGGGK